MFCFLFWSSIYLPLWFLTSYLLLCLGGSDKADYHIHARPVTQSIILQKGPHCFPPAPKLARRLDRCIQMSLYRTIQRDFGCSECPFGHSEYLSGRSEILAYIWAFWNEQRAVTDNLINSLKLLQRKHTFWNDVKGLCTSTGPSVCDIWLRCQSIPFWRISVRAVRKWAWQWACSLRYVINRKSSLTWWLGKLGVARWPKEALAAGWTGGGMMGLEALEIAPPILRFIHNDARRQTANMTLTAW